MAQYKLTYFDVRALAEPIRLLFALKGIEYEDVRIERADWPKLKPQFPWGNLPVLQDGDIQLAQSGAILRYLAKKFGLDGANATENAKCDEMIEVMGDVRQAFFKAHFEPDATKKEELVKTLKEETLPNYFKKFDDILAANGGFFVGKQVTYADLHMAAYIQTFDGTFPGVLDAFSNIKAHQEKIFALDGIKEWVAKRPVTQL